jgi:dephospho-CoA kinase
MNIIITGNIGCGKSTFTKMLTDRLPHYKLFDVDAEIHKLYLDDMFCKSLKGRFGTTDRAEISTFVFKNEIHREWLERLSKQYLQQRMHDAMIGNNTIFDFPLYFEHDGPIMFADQGAVVVTVFCDIDTQRERIAERGRFSVEKAEAIMAEQFSSTMKAALADIAVDTNQSLEQMAEYATEVANGVKMDLLELRFLNTFGNHDLWLQLQAAYTEEHRHYHGLMHLVNIFEQFDKVKPLMHDPLAVEIAIWWHDYVYSTDPESYPLSEYDSAHVMFQQLTAYHNGQLTQHSKRSAQIAAEMICATKGHQIRSPYILSRPELLNDCGLFLDMDLCGLGMGSTADIIESDEQIRAEFSQYSDLQFATGRIQAMSAFLNRPKLFHTETYAHLEEPARANIVGILERMKLVVDLNKNSARDGGAP